MKKAISLGSLLLLLTVSLSAQVQAGNERQSPAPLNNLHLALARSENDSIRLAALLNLMVYYWNPIWIAPFII
jgi:hypothetical protein